MMDVSVFEGQRIMKYGNNKIVCGEIGVMSACDNCVSDQEYISGYHV